MSNKATVARSLWGLSKCVSSYRKGAILHFLQAAAVASEVRLRIRVLSSSLSALFPP